MVDDPKVAKAIKEALDAAKKLEKQRDEEAKRCHESWNNTPVMKGHARKAHELHRDYLRIMYAIKKPPSSIPRQLIDFQKHTNMHKFITPILHFKVEINNTREKFDGQIKAAEGDLEKQKKLQSEKVQADVGLMAGLKEAMEDFNSTIGHFYLAKHDYMFNDAADNYHFYNDEKGVPTPNDGAVDPSSIQPLSVSQKNRGIKENTPVAFRGNLIAFELGFGDYFLRSLSELFEWTMADLHKKQIFDAGNIANRRLYGCKSKGLEEKNELVAQYQEIVGVAHRGVDTLNVPAVKAAKKRGEVSRIGDCMIKLRWANSETWETRTDFRAFKGQTAADWEIYNFANVARRKWKDANPTWNEAEVCLKKGGIPGNYLVYEDIEADESMESTIYDDKKEKYDMDSI
ncbi:hypothetical protein FPQ18DRAFT_327896 [Pyronema domesticum]|nr:hypothetical protein FPQ18DRAFT_327896 [Pyronema domesticum]